MELADAVRATTRGLGPAAQAEPFDMDAIAKLVEDGVQVVVQGEAPERPADAVWVASWWLLREIELSTATIGQTAFAGQCGQDSPGAVATLVLPISKADPSALGRRRALGCSCPSAACPVAALRRLAGGREQQQHHSWRHGRELHARRQRSRRLSGQVRGHVDTQTRSKPCRRKFGRV